MAYVQVVVVDEDGNPQKGVTVAAYSLANFPDIVARQTTDDAGAATFNVSGPVFFDAFNRRGVSMRDRNYPGKIQIQIVSFGNLMNVDYVVDSNGFGTHTTLFGATGALVQSITDQADRVIWICTTHVETVTSSVSLAGLANQQQIHIMSGGPYRPTITADLSDALFKQPTANAGTGWRYIFSGVNFAAASTKTPTIFKPNAGVSAALIEFWNCNFEGSGTWQYGLDLTGAGSATSGGIVFDNCRGTILAFAKISSGGAAIGPMVIRDCQMTISKFIDRTNNTDFEAGSSYVFTDNILTVSGSGPFAMTYTTGAANIRVVITGNDINFTNASNLFQFGTAGSASIKDILCSTNNIYCSSAGATAFAFVGPGGTPIANVNVGGNVLRGPGSGTAISASGISTVTDSVFSLNSFRDWTTEVSTSLPTSIPGPLKVAPTFEVEGNPDSGIRMVVIDSTGTGFSAFEFDRSGVQKFSMGLWPTTSVPAPFEANDFYFSVNDGTFHHVAAFDNSDYRFKINTNVPVNGWMWVGAGSSFTNPANTTAGDLTATRFIVNNTTFILSEGASLANIQFDTNDVFYYNKASDNFLFQVGGTQFGSLGVSGTAAQFQIGLTGTKNGILYLSTDNTDPGIIVLEGAGADTDWRIDAFGDKVRVLSTGGTEYHHLHATGFLTQGYARVGSLTAPTNTTAGDLTTIRLAVGNGTAFGPTTGELARIAGTLTDTAAGAAISMMINPTLSPASNSSSEFRALYFQQIIAPATGVTMNVIAANYVENRNRSDAAITELNAITGVAMVFDSSSPAAVGTVSTLRFLKPFYYSRAGTSTGAVTALNGIDFHSNRLNSAGLTVTTLTDMPFANLIAGLGTITTHVGIDMAKFTRASTNIEFRSAGKMVYTPTAQTLAAAGNTIVSTARAVDLDNSTGASLTMTSTPTIAVGVSDGQMLRLTNVDTADNIVLQDESVAAGTALRLTGAANLTLGPRDSVDFRWKASTSEWWACASANL